MNLLAGVWIVSVGPKVLSVGLMFPMITELVDSERVNVGAITVKVNTDDVDIAFELLSTGVTLNSTNLPKLPEYDLL